MDEEQTIAQKVGASLKEIRSAHGLSIHQSAMRYARETGKDPETSDMRAYISKAEHGAFLPKRDTLLALGRASRATSEELDALLQIAGYLPEWLVEGTDADTAGFILSEVKSVTVEHLGPLTAGDKKIIRDALMEVVKRKRS